MHPRGGACVTIIDFPIMFLAWRTRRVVKDQSLQSSEQSHGKSLAGREDGKIKISFPQKANIPRHNTEASHTSALPIER